MEFAVAIGLFALLLLVTAIFILGCLPDDES
jgi:hypothetical protein